MSKICRRCGIKNPDSSHYCQRCGKSLDSNEALPSWSLYVAIGLIIIAAVSYGLAKSRKASSQQTRVVTESDMIQKIIPGLYSVTLLIEGSEVSTPMNALNAEIRKDSTVAGTDNHYAIALVSDYDPELHKFEVLEGGKLSSPTLGEGTLTYKENIDRTTITFINGNTKWTFKK